VVLYDNVLDDLPRDQILSIVAHELGHARHNDVLIGSTLAALGTMLGVGLLGLAMSLIRPPGGMRDPTVVPLVLALVAIATVLSSPVNNGFSRIIETRADVASLEATRDPAAFVRMQRELDLHSLSDDPPTWSQFWFGSHPTTLERIAIAEQLGRRMGDSDK
jgi:STE24 endopeptidase